MAGKKSEMRKKFKQSGIRPNSGRVGNRHQVSNTPLQACIISSLLPHLFMLFFLSCCLNELQNLCQQLNLQIGCIILIRNVQKFHFNCQWSYILHQLSSFPEHKHTLLSFVSVTTHSSKAGKAIMTLMITKINRAVNKLCYISQQFKVIHYLET